MISTQPEASERVGFQPAGLEGDQGIDHDIADEMDLVRSNTLRRRFSRPLSSVMKRRSAMASVRSRLISSGMVRSKLRSPASTCATGYPELDRGEGGREGGVHIAYHEHQIRKRREEDRLEPSHDLCRLDRVRRRTDSEVEVGGRNLQVAEQLARHRLVIVLARVDEERDDRRVAAHLPDQRGDLHEVRTGAGNGDDAHEAQTLTGIGGRSIPMDTLCLP